MGVDRNGGVIGCDGFRAQGEWARSVGRLDHDFPFSFSLAKPVYGWDLEFPSYSRFFPSSTIA